MLTVLDLDHDQARKYFLQSENYTNIDLPKYFTFDEVLQRTSTKLGSSDVKSYFRTYKDRGGKDRCYSPKDFEGVNYKLLSNKDGEYAWRPFELIHPALYVSLVHKLTEEDNWHQVIARFEKFKATGVACESIPVVTDDDEPNKAKQINRWWTNVEQRSIEFGLKYQYVFDADITDCYGSIYTHSIAWALHTKKIAKKERDNKTLLGNIIDSHIQMMRHGQTNGIPQGSVLMDFISEMVLGYVDILITNKLADIINDEYRIIRYRDDYKIFTNNPESGRKIVKCLSEELSSLGLKLNTAKTKQKTDPILASVKEDKINELFIPKNKMGMQKWLLQIYSAADKNQNSGQVARLLTKYFDALDRSKKLSDFDNPLAMVSIAVNLALKNQKSYQWSMAIISKLLDFCDPKDRLNIIGDIRKKFDRLPNTGLLDIWLQRISYNTDPTISYGEDRLTLLVSTQPYPGNIFWISAWLKTDLQDIVSSTPVVSSEILHAIPDIIERAEVELFKRRYQ